MASPTPTSVPPDVSSIIPGTIFPDDIPPTLVDPSAGDPSQFSPPAGVGSSDGGGGTPQIEVNSTIQTVLIALGIVIGVLVLIAFVAAYYISRKNKSAEEQKEKEKEEKEKEKQLPPASDIDGDGPKTVVVMIHDPEKQQQKNSTGPLSFNSLVSSNGLLAEEIGNGGNASEDDSAGSGVGHGYSRSNTPVPETTAIFAYSNDSSIHSYPTPTGSRSVLSGAGIGSLGSSNPRNSMAHVTQAYANRQSILTHVGPSQSVGGVEGGHAKMSMDQEPFLAEKYRHLNPFYGNESPSTTESSPVLRNTAPALPSINPNSPSMILMDPFKTNNNSTASLNILEATSSTAIDEDEKGLTTSNDGSPAPPKDWSKAQEYLRQRKSEDSYNPRVVLRQSLKASPSPSAPANRYTMNILSEPITLLHSNTASTTSMTSGSSGALPVEISYQPPLTPTSPVAGFDRYASRRAVALAAGSAASHSNEELVRPSARNGAAVFEGATVQRGNRTFDNDGNGQDAITFENERRGRQSLDFSERLIVSLPISQGGPLDDDDDDRHNDDVTPPSRVFRHRHQPSNGTASGMPYVLGQEAQRELSQQHPTVGHLDPDMAVRASKDKKGDSGAGGKNSYLDDYREQQRLRKKEQQQKEVAAAAEGGILTTGRRRSSKFIQNAFHRASQLYAPSSSSSSSSTRDPRVNGQPSTAMVVA
ncbi:hypothetical protein EMPS_05149 [Entomortierella parvispora]|uniref:Uncharacterized protein n=1 Tax=Entomortierella parvispora TaxID=205924 RepID=A0A9P3LW32_9FUNG|nr:hypothetical protein EMPS_05149 [Entomortierella parvispora]